MLTTAAWADCPMQLGKDGKPMHQAECGHCKDCKDCAECCKQGKCEKDLKASHDAHAGHGDAHGAPQSDASESTRAYQQANAVMHKGMDITFTGDADIDFLKGMIAHHQGAVDMAQVQLKYGKDAQIKKLSRDIIRAQNLEIRWMKKWLGQLEARKGGYTDKGWIGDSSIMQ
jgi:hypothetical protein